MLPYRTIPIHECDEPMAPIPDGFFMRFDPPPYIAFGADYGGATPWVLRMGVLQGLMAAQRRLQAEKPGWKIMLFDAYRPNTVQIFMVEREFTLRAKAAGLDPTNLTPQQREQLGELVYKYWSLPSEDPLTPPPHSTGAVIDITLADDQGNEVDMGSAIDDGIPAADPAYFTNATDAAGHKAHINRLLLRSVMAVEGFHQHPHEWWHFSRGDQLWAWLQRQSGKDPNATAIYGRADLVRR